jgi:hypothetical protein
LGRVLGLDGQGLFAIGDQHPRQDLFTKRVKERRRQHRPGAGAEENAT